MIPNDEGRGEAKEQSPHALSSDEGDGAITSSEHGESNPATLREEDLPALYHSANASSLCAQRRFLRVTGAALAMVVLAAGAGAFTWEVGLLGTADVWGIVAAIAFGTAMLLRLYLLTNRPESTWYGGRAAAESAKTLAWRYAVGGEPFDVSPEREGAEALFIERLREILTDLDGTSLIPPPGNRSQIPQGMRTLRDMSRKERQEAYRVGRIEDQREWYRRKATFHRSRAERWNLLLLSIEMIGLVVAILKASGVVEIDYLGLTGAVVAAGASWLQARQHSNLSEAYAVASHELLAISDRVMSKRTESDWARFVSAAEEAISREHTLWRASKTKG